MYWDSTGEWRLTYYSELNKKNEKLLTRVEKNEKALDLLEKQLTYELLMKSSNSRMLDIGCGVGRQIIEFAECYPNKTFIGVDKSKHQIGLLNEILTKRKLKNVTGIILNAAEILNISGQYDLIAFYNNSFGCMNREEQILCLNSLNKILMQGGYILFSCFDKMEMIEECYTEWNLPIKNIDYTEGIVNLGEYVSHWKSGYTITFYYEKNPKITCIYKKHIGLGTVYIYQKSHN